MSDHLETWEIWFIKWRGSELARLVVRLAEVLLHRGDCTADDARAEPLNGDPRIRGAAMKTLVRLGLATMEPLAVKSTSDTCHHRPIQRFVLLDSNACRALTQRFAENVLKCRETHRYEVAERGQMLLKV